MASKNKKYQSRGLNILLSSLHSPKIQNVVGRISNTKAKTLLAELYEGVQYRENKFRILRSTFYDNELEELVDKLKIILFGIENLETRTNFLKNLIILLKQNLIIKQHNFDAVFNPTYKKEMNILSDFIQYMELELQKQIDKLGKETREIKAENHEQSLTKRKQHKLWGGINKFKYLVDKLAELGAIDRIHKEELIKDIYDNHFTSDITDCGDGLKLNWKAPLSWFKYFYDRFFLEFFTGKRGIGNFFVAHFLFKAEDISEKRVKEACKGKKAYPPNYIRKRFDELLKT
jgi:hypothetical protein